MADNKEEIKAVVNQTAANVRGIIGNILTEEDKKFANTVAREIAESGVYLSMGTAKEKEYASTAIKDLQLGIKARVAQAQIKATQAAQDVFTGTVTSLIKIFITLV